MGDVQRIFYLHVSLAVSAYLGFGVLFFSSILYLIKKSLYWDSLASSAGEVGLLFSTLVLITGSLWARPVWNVWWTWDPRLVTMLILWFIYIGYFMIRKAVTEKTRRARYSAIVGIIGFLDVPVVRLATRWWRSIHPRLDRESGGLDPLMVKVMIFSLVTFLIFAAVLIFVRFRIAWTEERLNTIISLSVNLPDQRSGRFTLAGFGLAFLLGIPFSMSFCPFCVPVVLSILTVAAATGKLWYSALLMLFFSLGRGIPLVIAGV